MQITSNYNKSPTGRPGRCASPRAFQSPCDILNVIQRCAEHAGALENDPRPLGRAGHQTEPLCSPGLRKGLPGPGGGSAGLLPPAGLHRLRRPRGPHRPHASRAGPSPAMGHGSPVPRPSQRHLSHPWPELHRDGHPLGVRPGRLAGPRRRRGCFHHPGHADGDGLGRPLCPLPSYAGPRRHPLRGQASGPGPDRSGDHRPRTADGAGPPRHPHQPSCRGAVSARGPRAPAAAGRRAGHAHPPAGPPTRTSPDRGRRTGPHLTLHLACPVPPPMDVPALPQDRGDPVWERLCAGGLPAGGFRRPLGVADGAPAAGRRGHWSGDPGAGAHDGHLHRLPARRHPGGAAGHLGDLPPRLRLGRPDRPVDPSDAALPDPGSLPGWRERSLPRADGRRANPAGLGLPGGPPCGSDRRPQLPYS